MSRTLGNTIGATAGLREGCAEIAHTYPFSYNTTGITSGVMVDVINATTDSPVEIEISVQVITAFNDTTSNTIEIGASAGDATYLEVSGADPGVVGYYPASNAVAKFRLTSTLPLFITYTPEAGDATTGEAILIVREFTQNILPVVL